MAGGLGRVLGRALSSGLRSALRTAVRDATAPRSGRTRTRGGTPTVPPSPREPREHGEQGEQGEPREQGGYPGDFTGTAVIEYDPREDGVADPGEVVWGWVPFEEDHARGKDRPALVVGRDGRWVLALMLTSRDHDRDAAQEARHGREWLDVGSGGWDARGRPSEVRLDRVLRLDPDGIRREGGRLDRRTFDRVAAALRERHGWR